MSQTGSPPSSGVACLSTWPGVQSGWLHTCITVPIYCLIIPIIHIFMRDEKELRKKQARSNKQQGKATQHTRGSHLEVALGGEK